MASKSVNSLSFENRSAIFKYHVAFIMKDIKGILVLNASQKWHEFYIEMAFKVFKMVEV